MVFEVPFVRRAYTQVLAHEFKKVVRMVRAFPAERFDERSTGCGESARELAAGFVHRVRTIDDLAYAGAGPLSRPVFRTRGELLLELETAFLGAHTSLAGLSAAEWAELIPSPAGLAVGERSRRGELLWLALRDLITHDRHFARHMTGDCPDRGGPRRQVTPERVLDEIAIGA